jgi:hypothetical protein
MPVRNLIRPFVIAAGVAALCIAAVGASAAQAASPMWIGFHDDPIFRYDPQRPDSLDNALAANATITRTLVTWAHAAPTKPANAANPFDPAYKLNDVDEIVRNAQVRGMEVLITIWGTPAWANGKKGPAYLPTKMADFRNFARALASRYSGRYAGYPFVRFYGVWNESNIGVFLQPQFNAKGRIVGPAAYAKLAAAGYAGIKSGNAKALVAIGETSSTGRDKKSKGTDTVAPATFARMVAEANPKLKFDAWAQHPYPYPVNMKATQKVRYPNVNLPSLPQFEKDLDKWFKRKNIPIWITEYGHETRPGEPKGVTEGQQALYMSQAIAMAKADPRVQMFVWFVFQDSAGSLWQSGVYRPSGAAKPALAKFTSAAAAIDARNPTVRLKGGTKSPVVTAYLRTFCANNPIGATVGAVISITANGKPLGTTTTATALAIDCTAPVKLPITVAKGSTYVATIDFNTKIGDRGTTTITVVGT